MNRIPPPDKPRHPCTLSNSVHQCLLDRISVTGIITHDTVFERWLRDQDDVEPASGAPPLYPQGWTFQNAPLHISTGNAASGASTGTTSAYRLDWNPNDLEASQRAANLLNSGAVKLPGYITRVDVAIDYRTHDFSEARFDRPRSKRVFFYGVDDAIETAYLGAPSSRRRFRIYDKQRERLAAGEPNPGQWWRFEAQLREQIVIPPDQAAPTLPGDLFQAIRVRFLPDDPTTEQVRVFFDRRYLASVKGYQRKRRAAVLQSCPTLPPDEHPQAIYEAHKGQLEAELALICMGAERMTEQ